MGSTATPVDKPRRPSRSNPPGADNSVEHQTVKYTTVLRCMTLDITPRVQCPSPTGPRVAAALSLSPRKAVVGKRGFPPPIHCEMLVYHLTSVIYVWGGRGGRSL